MAKLAIIWHSRTGGAEAMAKTAAAGAEGEDGLELRLVRARDTRPELLLECDGYIFVFPENLAAIAGEMKEFFDRSYYEVLGRIEGRPYAAMVCAGSDGENALKQAERIATGWRLKKVADNFIVCTHAQSPETILAPKEIAEAELEKCRQLGATLAAGLAMGVF